MVKMKSSSTTTNEKKKEKKSELHFIIQHSPMLLNIEHLLIAEYVTNKMSHVNDV